MQRRNDGPERAELWLERLVWNAAAGAALAVMIFVLLASFRLLDAVEREVEHEATAAPAPPPAVAARGPDARR